MLKTLTINNLTIIDNISINFDEGFNVITGETGAGKSVLVKALSLILGNKGGSELLKKNAQSASVVAEFTFPISHPSYKLLQDLNIPTINEDKQYFDLIVRRNIQNSGKTNAWINDIPVTISTLKILGSNLIDVFAQNESFKLQDPAEHIFFLDKLLKKPHLKQEFVNLYKIFIKKVERIKELLEQYNNQKQSEDYLKFRLEELNKFNLSQEEFDELCNKRKELLSLQKSKHIIDKITLILEKGSYTQESINKEIWNIVRLLKELSEEYPQTYDLLPQAEAIAKNLDDWSYEFYRKTSVLDTISEEEIEKIEQRISDYNSLLRKLNVNNLTELIDKKQQLEDQINNIERVKLQIENEIIECEKIAENLYKKAEELTRLRKNAAQELKILIEKELAELDMSHAKFHVEIKPINKHLNKELDLRYFKHNEEVLIQVEKILNILNQLDTQGADKVEFLIATNKNSDFYPISKIASGGEISRIMLSLKKIMSEGADTCVLIFDEIDTGISGKTANIVGKKLKELSKTFQVICISHLAQVSAYANKHFKSEKNIIKDNVKFVIKPLSYEESITEIARLLSGEKITKASLENAKELIYQAAHN